MTRANRLNDDETAVALGFRLPFLRWCCSSCHEDANSFGFDLCEVEFLDGRVGWVCCDYIRNFQALGAVTEDGKEITSGA
jgi:hypothetical protein